MTDIELDIKQYKALHRENKVSERDKQRYHTDKNFRQKRIEYSQKWQKEHPNEVKFSQNKWNKSEQGKAYHREWKRKWIEKLKQDPVKYAEYLEKRRLYKRKRRQRLKEIKGVSS